MNYGKIVEDSFSFAWRYKSLWIFGLFAGSGGNFNMDFGTNDLSQADFAQFDSWEPIWQMIVPILAAVLVMGLILFVLHLICSPALVDAVNKIARGGTYKFSESYSRGIDFFFRKLGLTMILIAAVVGIILLAVLPIVAINIFGLLLLFPIVIVGAFFAITLYSLAERAMVVRDTSIGDAIDEAYVLMKQNFSKCIVIALIFLGLSFGMAIVFLMLAAMLYFPVNMLVHAMSENRSIIFILGLILGLPITLVIGGFVGTFFHSLYTLFYFGLVDPASPYATPRSAAVPQAQ
ncbi:MAG TPA: hypothetical protein VHP63_08475 [candidate division Zixibacteria bacterium]|nr:hypothetical protein [candidate division Zixibacteria bacterium]